MKIDRYINRALALLFPSKNHDRLVWFWSSSDRRDHNGKPKGFPYEGRCSLNVGQSGKAVKFSWNLWTHFIGTHFNFNPTEDGWGFFIGLRPVAFWFNSNLIGTERMRRWMASPEADALNQATGGYPGSSRYTTYEFFHLSLHTGALFWTFRKFDWGWSRQMPRWMSGSFHFDDFFLGSTKHKREVLETKEVQIPMPEGCYPAKAKLEKATWKRPRWFTTERYYVNLDIPQGIPHNGKGENAHDCGEDGLFGCSSEGTSYEKAIAHAVEIVLKDRRRYGGSNYPNPADRPAPSQTN